MGYVGGSYVVDQANTETGVASNASAQTTALQGIGSGVAGTGTVELYSGGIAIPGAQFNFLSGVLSPLITFSRSSNGTIVNSNGQIAYAPHNLLTNSESFEASAWSKTTTTVTSNVIAAPDGTLTAEKIESTGTFPSIHQDINFNGSIATLSVYFKKGNVATDNNVLLIRNQSTATNILAARLNLDTGEITYLTGSSGASAQNIGNGWWRFTLTTSFTFGNVLRAAILGGYISVIGNYSYIWGAQLEVGSTATTYNSTTPKNLLGYTEEFDNAAWTKSNSFVQTNLLLNSTTLATQNVTTTAVPYTLSFYGTGTVTLSGTSTGSLVGTGTNNRVTLTFTPTAGTLTLTVSGTVTQGQLVQGSTAGDYARTDSTTMPVKYTAPNGFANAEKLVETTAASSTHYILQSPTTSAANNSYSVYFKKAERKYVMLYHATSNAGSIFDLDTAAVSTPSGGIVAPIRSSCTNVGNGWYRCEIVITATAAANGFRVYLCDSSTTFSYTGDGTSGVYIYGAQLSNSASLDPYVYNPAAALTSVAYYAPRFTYDPVTLAPQGLLVEESRTNLLLNSNIDGTNLATQNITTTAAARTLSFYGTGSIVLSGTHSATVTGAGANTRTTYTYTPTAGTLTLTVSGTVKWAQDELGAFATSYIPTGASSVTRAADVAVVQGNNFKNWYNLNNGTVYINASTFATTVGGSAIPFTISDGTSNNRIQSFYADTTQFYVRSGGTVLVSFTCGAIIKNIPAKVVGAYNTNDYAATLNAGALQTASSGVPPVVDRMNIGSNYNSASQFNGTISQINYYTSRLQNSQLQSLTA